MRIENVHYTPGLKSNYISHGQLKRLGYKTIETEDGFDIYKDGKFVLRTTLNELNHFEMEGDWVPSQVCSMIRRDVRKLPVDELYVKWHRKLGHICFGYLIQMRERLKIQSRPDSKLQCNDCTLNKCKRKPFKKRKKNVDRPLRLIHSDVCGQIDIPNLLGVRYFVTFQDDYSRHISVYLMKRKSEVIQFFKDYKAFMEKQTGFEIMSIRTDGGGEYTSTEFENLLRAEGISIQRTCRDSPAINGVAERANQTLLYMAKTMIHAAGLKVEVWPYAVQHAAFLHNLLITAGTNLEIPLYRLHNCNPNFDEIIEFGAPVVSVNTEKLPKFAPNGIAGRFLGYPEDHDGCLIYIESERKVIISRDVFLLQDVDQKIADPDLEKFEYAHLGYSNSAVADCDRDLGEPEPVPIGPIPMLTAPAVERLQDRDMITDESPNPDQSFITARSSPNSAPSSPSLQRSVSDQQPEVPDRQLRPVRLATGETFADLPIGSQITLNFEEEKRFRENFPDRQLVKGRYVKSCLPGKHRSFVVNAIRTPTTFAQAVEGPDSAIWAPAILEEYNNWQALNMFKRVERPKDKKVIGLIWVFSTKYAIDGTLEKAKARLCALGNRQTVDWDAIDTYAPTMRPIVMRSMMSLAVNRAHRTFHIDVKAAFLNSRLMEPVYCYPPAGFENPDKPNEVWELHGAAYGLRESAKAWNDTLTKILAEFGLKPTLSDTCLFQNEDHTLLVGVHVDDMLISVDSDEKYREFADFLKSKVEISEKGEVSTFLGYELDWQCDRLLINQKAYIKSALERFDFAGCHPVRSPMILGQDLEATAEDKLLRNRVEFQEMCGTLMYLANGTRVDICYAVNRLCRYMANPTERHFECLKRIFRYLKGTIDFSLIYSCGNQELIGYADADFANDKMDSKSISGICTFLCGNLIDWSSRKQSTVALSTCEAETLAIRNESCSILFMRGLLEEIGLKCFVTRPTVILNDNLSASLTLKDGGAFHRNNHYRIRVNFIRDLVNQQMLTVLHVPGTQMIADLLTKPLAPVVLQYLLNLIAMGSSFGSDSSKCQGVELDG